MKPFIAIESDRIYRLRLTIGAIIEYEQLTGYKLMDMDYRNEDMLSKILFVMMRQENPALNYKAVQKDKSLLPYAAAAISAAFPEKKSDSTEIPKPVFLEYEDELKIAIGTLGMTPSDFFALTPGEFSSALSDYNIRQRIRYNDRMSQAWHEAYWQRVDYKYFPSLKSVLVDTAVSAEPQKAQTPEEMMTICKLLNAALGGEVVECTDKT